MRKPAGKRLPHGATSDLLLAAMWNIYMRAGRTEPVSRAELVKALSFPETTVDDRLRVLVKRKKVMKVGRGLYAPIRQKDERIFDRYWRQRSLLDRALSPQEERDKAAHEPKPVGTKTVRIFPGDVIKVERWLSVADYCLSEIRGNG